jgi:hypothetical protein
MITKEAQDLKSGDIFEFRSVLYGCISNITDQRHTQTIITAITFGKLGYVLIRFFRTFKIEIKYHLETELIKLENTREEITPEIQTKLEEQMKGN